MTGAMPPSLLAKVLLIMAGKFLVFLAPFFAVAALWWLAGRTERIIHYLFPNLAWEHSLGWLNIRAERRAKAALRWLGYAIYLLLAAALLGIVTGVKGLQEMDAFPDPYTIGNAMLFMGMIVVSLGAWILFLGLWLIPQRRARIQNAELRRFRAEMAEVEAEEAQRRPSRVKSPLAKPRGNSPAEASSLDRIKRRR